MGTVIDRVDRRKLIVWATLANMAMVVVMGTLVATHLIQVWHIYVGSIIGFANEPIPGVAHLEFEQARQRLAASGYGLTDGRLAWRAFSERRGGSSNEPPCLRD